VYTTVIFLAVFVLTVFESCHICFRNNTPISIGGLSCMVYIMCLLFLLLLVVFVFFIYPVYFSEFASPEAISPKESLWQLMEQIFKRPDQMPFLLSNHGIKALNVVHIICILSAILASFMVLLAI